MKRTHLKRLTSQISEVQRNKQKVKEVKIWLIDQTTKIMKTNTLKS